MTPDFPNATPRPWTIDMLEGGGWAVVVDADGHGAQVVAELDETVGDRAANAALIVEAVNRFIGPVALAARVRQRITDAFEGEYGEQEALEAFAENGWPGTWAEVVEANDPDDTAIMILEPYAGRMSAELYEDLQADIAEAIRDERDRAPSFRESRSVMPSLAELTPPLEPDDFDEEWAGELDCTWCGGEGTQDCDDPLGCPGPHDKWGNGCPCGACRGTGLRSQQTVF